MKIHSKKILEKNSKQVVRVVRQVSKNSSSSVELRRGRIRSLRRGHGRMKQGKGIKDCTGFPDTRGINSRVNRLVIVHAVSNPFSRKQPDLSPAMDKRRFMSVHSSDRLYTYRYGNLGDFLSPLVDVSSSYLYTFIIRTRFTTPVCFFSQSGSLEFIREQQFFPPLHPSYVHAILCAHGVSALPRGICTSFTRTELFYRYSTNDWI